MRRLPFLVLTLALCAGTVGATTLIEMEFQDLVQQADRIATGTVTDLQGVWDDSGTFIHTLVTLRIDRYLQGDGPATLTLRTPGGQIGDQAVLAQGAPSFTIGERVLAFLTTWEDGAPKVLGYAQGKSRLTVREDGRVVLQGGVSDGMTLDGVAREIQNGPRYNVPLRPVTR